jgi:hypothetical protein
MGDDLAECGPGPEKSVLSVQSDIKSHAELVPAPTMITRYPGS